MRTVFIIEKPSVRDWITKALGNTMRVDEMDFVACYPFGAWWQPLPAPQDWHHYPTIAPWSVETFVKNTMPHVARWPLFGRGSGPFEPNDRQAREVLSEADDIYVMFDHYHRFFHADVLMRKMTGQGIRPGQARIPRSAMPDDIRSSFDNHACEVDQQVLDLVEHGAVRDYFNFQFRVNSVRLLAYTLGTSQWISKYQIQTLFILARTGTVKIDDLINKMEHNSGFLAESNALEDHISGSLGSMSSYISIIGQLEKHGWVEMAGRHCMMTAQGHAVISSLHPHCEDPDLPFRIDRWAQVGLGEARAQINQYILNFFGQQKQYFMQNNYQT